MVNLQSKTVAAGKPGAPLPGVPAQRFCVAPMMDWTDRHCRYFMRLLTRHALLYTEMVTTGALLHGDQARFLAHDPFEYPLALQLGGSDPQQLAACARLAAEAGFQEVNLNVGCPSDRVQNASIGACLMAEPALVAECIAAMQEAASIPITVKCRIGIDGRDSYEQLCDFVTRVSEEGSCRIFIVHARIAILAGLSPKQNREIPPLRHDTVYRLKRDFPHLRIIINGGITNLDQAESMLQHVDGVMLGREAYQNPYILAGVDQRFFSADSPTVESRLAALESFYPYIARELAQGTALKHMTRHLLGLFQGLPGAKRFRRHLSEQAHRPDADLRTLQQAAALLGRPRTEAATAPQDSGETHVGEHQQVF